MMDRPKPDWAGKTKQPQGELGPPPGPNGRIVATQPGSVTFGTREMCVRDGRAYPFMVPTVEPITYVSPPRQRTVADIEAEIRRATIPGFRPEDV